jgi:hypothetical protein
VSARARKRAWIWRWRKVTDGRARCICDVSVVLKRRAGCAWRKVSMTSKVSWACVCMVRVAWDGWAWLCMGTFVPWSLCTICIIARNEYGAAGYMHGCV